MTDDALRRAYAELLREGVPPDRGACPPPEALLALVERVGDERDRMRTLDHVMSCALCRRDFDLLRTATQSATQSTMQSATLPGSSGARAGTRRALPWRPLAIAAGLVVAVGVGVLSRESSRRAPLLRGSEHTVSLLGPEPRPDGSLALRWRRVPDATRYRVELFAPSGRMVSGATITDSVFVVPRDVVLSAGDSLRWMVTALRPDGGELHSRSERLAH